MNKWYWCNLYKEGMTPFEKLRDDFASLAARQVVFRSAVERMLTAETFTHYFTARAELDRLLREE